MIYRRAMEIFQRNLKGEPLQYLTEIRGMSLQTIEDFCLGYAPDSWDYMLKALKKDGFSENEIIDAGLARRSKSGRAFDFFRNRIIFPIFNVNGKCIAFGGRQWKGEDGPKYINSPETASFQKKRELFALSRVAKEPQNIIVCEGYMDAIALQNNGFKTAVAGLGTALTLEQCLLLKSFSENIILLYDNDNAGLAATKAAIDTLSEVGVSPRIARMKWAKDADEFLNMYPAYIFRDEILSQTIDVTEFMFEFNRISGHNVFEKNLSLVINELMKI